MKAPRIFSSWAHCARFAAAAAGVVSAGLVVSVFGAEALITGVAVSIVVLLILAILLVVTA